MQPRLRATLVVGAIVVASAIAGAAIDRTFLVHQPRRGPRPGHSSPAQDAHRRTEMLDRMSRDLGLTPVQRVAIDSVFRRTDSTLNAIGQETEPRVRQALERSHADIAARLDSTQRVKYLQQAAERARRHQAGAPRT